MSGLRLWRFERLREHLEMLSSDGDKTSPPPKETGQLKIALITEAEERTMVNLEELQRSAAQVKEPIDRMCDTFQEETGHRAIKSAIRHSANMLKNTLAKFNYF